jgi:hypothetical protein
MSFPMMSDDGNSDPPIFPYDPAYRPPQPARTFTAFRRDIAALASRLLSASALFDPGALMINSPDHCATSDEWGMEAKVDRVMRVAWMTKDLQRREPATYIKIAIFRSHCDEHDYYTSQRLTLEEARTLGQWLTKRAKQLREPWWRRLYQIGRPSLGPPSHCKGQDGRFVPIAMP